MQDLLEIQELGIVTQEQLSFINQMICTYLESTPIIEHQQLVFTEIEQWKPITRHHFWRDVGLFPRNKFVKPWYSRCFSYEFFDWTSLYNAKIYFGINSSAKFLSVLDEFYYLHCMKEMEKKRPELFQEMKEFISGRVSLIQGFERLFR